jgi:hypothetical protein
MAPARAPAIMKNTSLLNEKSILNLVAAAVVVFLSIRPFFRLLPSYYFYYRYPMHYLLFHIDLNVYAYTITYRISGL